MRGCLFFQHEAEGMRLNRWNQGDAASKTSLIRWGQVHATFLHFHMGSVLVTCFSLWSVLLSSYAEPAVSHVVRLGLWKFFVLSSGFLGLATYVHVICFSAGWSHPPFVHTASMLDWLTFVVLFRTCFDIQSYKLYFLESLAFDDVRIKLSWF